MALSSGVHLVFFTTDFQWDLHLPRSTFYLSSPCLYKGCNINLDGF